MSQSPSDDPWTSAVQRMKETGVELDIELPHQVATLFKRHIPGHKGPVTVTAKFDKATDGIRVTAFTGVEREEELTYPEHDGYGRYETEREKVTGTVNLAGNRWLVKPQIYFI